MIRRPASFVTSMTDERGDELMYSGVKISEVVESGKGIGGVIALLWFQVELYVDYRYGIVQIINLYHI